MRQIVLDTETTGTDAQRGDRIIEIACIELIDRQPTGDTFHCYLNPQRDSHPEALKVHGLSTAFLADKPLFSEIAPRFLDYVRGAEVIAHNAAFDVAFLDAELARCTPSPGLLRDHVAAIIDTYHIARERFPGERASLDALCKRFDVDTSGYEELHGAMCDAQLLAPVYLALTKRAPWWRGGSARDFLQRLLQRLRTL